MISGPDLTSLLTTRTGFLGVGIMDVDLLLIKTPC